MKPGDTIFLNDGFIQLEVVKVEGKDVRCRVLVGGELRSRKGLNLPGIDLGISAFTERDREGLKFAADNGVDAVSQSFVQSGADIDDRPPGGGSPGLPSPDHRQDRAVPGPGPDG